MMNGKPSSNISQIQFWRSFTIVRAFSHQISHIVDSHGGYVLKYAGDAVISFFPDHINNNKYRASGLSVECSKSMIIAIKRGD